MNIRLIFIAVIAIIFMLPVSLLRKFPASRHRKRFLQPVRLKREHRYRRYRRAALTH